jgi:uncharacterized protein (TIGR02001 family)
MEYLKMNTRKSALVALALLTTGVAQADVSANLGFVSDYYFRGIFQAPNSVNGGIDYERNGFFVGTWAADVKDGLEINGYGGYGGAIGDFSYSIGYTRYFYTGDFDDTYQEINLGGSYGILALDVAVGQYDNFDGPTQDYTYYSLTVEKNGFYGKYAGFTQDFAGEYFEAGFSTSVAEIDVGIAAIFANEDLVGANEESLVLSISKSFDLK